ncbi:MAG: endonuclease V [Pseudomonadota bacterium]
MILAVDVHYPERGAIAAALAFDDWTSPTPTATYVSRFADVEAYAPGAFYRRELPCILGLLQEYGLSPDCIVIDGHAFLDDEGRAGLGKHLFDALQGRIPVIGVAKSAFAGTSADAAVLRGNSARPLYVTAVGLPQEEAKAHVRAMHGAHRIPTLLKRVDRQCRQASPA